MSTMNCAITMEEIVVEIMWTKANVVNVLAMRPQESILTHYRPVSKSVKNLSLLKSVFTDRGEWYQELSDNQCVISWLGDEICQKVNNHGLCHFDGGDCCVRTEFSTKLCSDCVCLHGSKFEFIFF